MASMLGEAEGVAVAGGGFGFSMGGFRGGCMVFLGILWGLNGDLW